MVTPAIARALAEHAAGRNMSEVRAQIACTARRLPAADALPVIARLLTQSGDVDDPRLPLLIWWAVEARCGADRDSVLKLFEDTSLWFQPMTEKHLLERLMRRFAAAGTRADLLTCARLLELSPGREHSEILMRGLEAAFQGRSFAGLPDELVAAIARHDVGSDVFRVRQKKPEAVANAVRLILDRGAKSEQRLRFIEVLGEVRPPGALDAILSVADNDADAALRRAALGALLGYEDARIPATVIRDFNAYAPEVRAAALTLMGSRATWALALVEAVDAGRIRAADVPRDAALRFQVHGGEKLAGLVAKHWPGGRPGTEAMRQQTGRFAEVIRSGKGDPYAGQKLFNAACAACHRLFARGGDVGPDLTPYPRADVDTLLLHIVNPSAEIREGYENILVETTDDRSLTGFLVRRDDRLVVLRGPDGQSVSVERKDIQEMRAAGLSLMPEGLLDGLGDQQLRDLFAYLRSTQPLAN